MCFLVRLSLFNSSSLPIFSFYYSQVTLILCLFTHSPSSSTCYLLYFTPPLLHCSPLPLLPFLCSCHPLSLFIVRLISSFLCPLFISLSSFFHPTISSPSCVSPPLSVFYCSSSSLCLLFFLSPSVALFITCWIPKVSLLQNSSPWSNWTRMILL